MNKTLILLFCISFSNAVYSQKSGIDSVRNALIGSWKVLDSEPMQSIHFFSDSTFSFVFVQPDFDSATVMIEGEFLVRSETLVVLKYVGKYHEYWLQPNWSDSSVVLRYKEEIMRLLRY